MKESVNGGPGYTPAGKKSPGLIVFLLDRSLPKNIGTENPLDHAIHAIYEQINSIKDRFKTNNKLEHFRFVVIEFANAPQRKGSYLIDDFVENVSTISYGKEINFARVKGTSLKKALNEANNCVNHHLQQNVTDKRWSKPPISVILFSGNRHKSSLDKEYDTNMVGVWKETEYSNNSVDYYANLLISKENVFFGVFEFISPEGAGEKVNTASIISKELIDRALSKERMYGVQFGNSMKSIWADPYKELVGREFLFNKDEFSPETLNKFLAVMLKLGTYTNTFYSNEDDEEDERDLV